MKTAAVSVPRPENIVSDVFTLVKARLSFLVLLTTLVGFLLGWTGPVDYLVLAVTLAGTALCAAGAAALNQWWERDLDALMKRTRNRPLPGRRMHPADALLFGLLLSLAGLAILGFFTNWRAAFLAFATIVIYVLVYTPMKRMSSLNTLVGAIPGALPPLIGWVAARGEYNLEGGLLFAIMWFWQMPHFLAIAWMYKEDYANAGCVMLPGRDEEGRATSLQALLYLVCLVMITLIPGVLGYNNAWYFPFALALGIGFAVPAFFFMKQRDRASARNLFLGSILYLPLLLALLVATKAG